VTLPVLLEPDELEAILDDESLIIVDLSTPNTFAANHIPNALPLPYADLVHGEKPAPGLLPEVSRLSRVCSHIGLAADRHVVAYDDEGGGRASRLLWTLHVLGHANASVLNGGIQAWTMEGHPVTRNIRASVGSNYTARPGDTAIADKDYVVARLQNPQVALLDARTPEEFAGVNVRALRGGHIPGARNLNWLDTIDRSRNLRLKPAIELQNMLERLELTPDKEIITYCQTHHRSSHSYLMLKALGYPQVRGYAGSWSEWGNRTDTPVEVG